MEFFMIDKYLVDYDGMLMGIKFDPKNGKVIVGTKQRFRPFCNLLVTSILGFDKEEIKDIVFRQSNRVRYIIYPKDVQRFLKKVDNLNNTNFQITARKVKKIHTTVM